MYENIIKAAIAAREKAYAPYSNFCVGAAVLGVGGKIFSGCNVENGSHAAGCCAERVAINKAVSEGITEFSAICVVGGIRGEALDYCPPCGVCRQVMSEFCGGDFKIVLARSEKEYKVYTLSELLPEAFNSARLK